MTLLSFSDCNLPNTMPIRSMKHAKALVRIFFISSLYIAIQFAYSLIFFFLLSWMFLFLRLGLSILPKMTLNKLPILPVQLPTWWDYCSFATMPGFIHSCSFLIIIFLKLAHRANGFLIAFHTCLWLDYVLAPSPPLIFPRYPSCIFKPQVLHYLLCLFLFSRQALTMRFPFPWPTWHSLRGPCWPQDPLALPPHPAIHSSFNEDLNCFPL